MTEHIMRVGEGRWYSQGQLDARIKEAVLAERERCAKIVKAKRESVRIISLENDSCATYVIEVLQRIKDDIEGGL